MIPGVMNFKEMKKYCTYETKKSMLHFFFFTKYALRNEEFLKFLSFWFSDRLWLAFEVFAWLQLPAGDWIRDPANLVHFSAKCATKATVDSLATSSVL